jgi:S1-C subfamily serine protease
VRIRRVAATLLVGFTVGFTAYHVAFRPAPAPVVTDPGTEPGGPSVSVQAPAGTGAPAALPAALRERIGLIDLNPQPGTGWRIRQVQPGSPAFRSGLRPDDVLKALDGAALPPSPEEFDALAPRLLERNEIRIRILRGGTEQEVVVKLHDPASPEKEKPVAPGPQENK